MSILGINNDVMLIFTPTIRLFKGDELMLSSFKDNELMLRPLKDDGLKLF